MKVALITEVDRELSPTTYFVELARQLSEFLVRWLPQRGGIVSLIDLYGLYNRARGSGEVLSGGVSTNEVVHIRR